MKSLIYLLCVILLSGLSSSHVAGQIWLSNEDIFDEAEEYLNADEYVEALPLYLLLEKKKISNPHIDYKIGTCFLSIRGKKHLSIPYLERAVESVSDSFENVFSETNAPQKALLLLGVAYRIDGQVEKALETFKYLRERIEKTDPDFLVVIDLHIQRCENAKLLNAFPNEPRTERLPEQINTAFSNYNPVLVDHDSLLYYMEELKFYDALMKVRNVNGEWGIPENLTPKIGSDGDHILVGAAPDGNTLFLYYYEPLRAGEIYYTELVEGKWTPIKPLNENINTVYHETHASISSDGQTLYFTSNRNGGYGGLDIYMSEKDENDDWGPAINLGPKINTPFNEETPVINVDDEILYFSSQGHLSMGGYDIFYALRRDDTNWRQPINMGAPVSTTDDDLFYYPLDEHVSGLMSRIEDASMSYDIYRYNSMVFANSPRFNVRGKAEGIDSSNFSDYSVAVVHTETGDTLNRIPVSPGGDYEAMLPAGDFDLVINDMSGNVGVAGVELNDDSPEVTLVGEMSGEDTVLIEALIDTLMAENLDDKKDSIVSQEAQVIPELLAKVDTFQLKNILYRFDDFKVEKEYHSLLDEIQELMISNPDLKFLVEGHTDDLGPASYNLILSRKRAEAVVDYIVGGAISKDRFEIIGKGEGFPVATNKNNDGSDCSEGRLYNRRVVMIPDPELDGILFIRMAKIPPQLRVQE